MPSAGDICPPCIVPLIEPEPGKAHNQIDSGTYVQISTESQGCRIFFSTDGSRPTPYHSSVGGGQSFPYSAPFTLREGKRLLRAIAVRTSDSRESHVMSKTFYVEPALSGSHDTLDDFFGHNDPYEATNDTSLTEDSLTPSSDDAYWCRPLPKPTRSSFELPTRRRVRPRSPTRASYTSLNGGVTTVYDEGWSEPVDGTSSPKAEMELEGPFNPVNYSGTQVNVWGKAPPGPLTAGRTPGLSNTADPGFGTNNSKKNRLATVKDIKKVMKKIKESSDSSSSDSDGDGKKKKKGKSKDKKTDKKTDKKKSNNTDDKIPESYLYPPTKPSSPGNGEWREQLFHVYSQLLDYARNSPAFRIEIGEPKLSSVLEAEVEEEEDKITITISMKTAGKRRIPYKRDKKPARVPTPPPVRSPSPQPRPTLKSVASAKSVAKQIKSKAPATPPPPPPKKTVTTKEIVKAVKEKPQAYLVTEEYECEGTVTAAPNFNAEQDAEKLRKAMKGLGTDEQSIIDVLCFRDNAQRLQIKKTFKTMFGKDLIKELDGELSGNFRKAIKALMLSPAEADAKWLYNGMKGLGTDDDCLVEIICTRTNAQLVALKEQYQTSYGKSLEDAVIDDTSGHFKRILVSLLQGNRDESPTYDMTKVKEDAKALHEAGEKKWGTDESRFNVILASRSNAHLRALFDEYEKVAKVDLEESIKSEMSGDLKNAMLSIVRAIRNKPGYFATSLVKSMKGLGTKDETLVRIIVSRCEADMVQIMEEFEAETGQKLAAWIADDTSGDYKKTLLALIGSGGSKQRSRGPKLKKQFAAKPAVEPAAAAEEAEPEAEEAS